MQGCRMMSQPTRWSPWCIITLPKMCFFSSRRSKITSTACSTPSLHLRTFEPPTSRYPYCWWKKSQNNHLRCETTCKYSNGTSYLLTGAGFLPATVGTSHSLHFTCSSSCCWLWSWWCSSRSSEWFTRGNTSCGVLAQLSNVGKTSWIFKMSFESMDELKMFWGVIVLIHIV